MSWLSGRVPQHSLFRFRIWKKYRRAQRNIFCSAAVGNWRFSLGTRILRTVANNSLGWRASHVARKQGNTQNHFILFVSSCRHILTFRLQWINECPHWTMPEIADQASSIFVLIFTKALLNYDKRHEIWIFEGFPGKLSIKFVAGEDRFPRFLLEFYNILNQNTLTETRRWWMPSTLRLRWPYLHPRFSHSHWTSSLTDGDSRAQPKCCMPLQVGGWLDYANLFRT